MSLRARLVLCLLALAGLGLLVAGAITYAEQKSFLIDRLDQQVAASLPTVSRQLDETGANVPGYGGAHHDFDEGHGPGGPPGAAVNLPPGTFGQRQDAFDREVARGEVRRGWIIGEQLRLGVDNCFRTSEVRVQFAHDGLAGGPRVDVQVAVRLVFETNVAGRGIRRE